MTTPPPQVAVWARLDLPGMHRWPFAPPHRAYLASPHRHLFRVTAEVAVGHDDRQVEFHDLHDMIRAWWGTAEGIRDCGTASCERMARELAAYLDAQHGLRVTRVEVSEDGEAGAVVCPAAQAPPGGPPPAPGRHYATTGSQP